MPRATLSMLLYWVSALIRIFLQVLLAVVLDFWGLHFCTSLAEHLLSGPHLMHLFLGTAVLSCYRM